MRITGLFFLLTLSLLAKSQDISSSLSKAMQQLESDASMKYASIGFYVVHTKTGKLLFDKNSQVGLAPASTLKVLTSASAYELLGKDFVYETKFLLDGRITKDIFNGELKIEASGDPTLGSWRWKQTSREQIVMQLASALKGRHIKFINGKLALNTRAWDIMSTPDGWIWEDVGNYYGAGARILNWHENSYNLYLKPGKNIGDSVKITGTEPVVSTLSWFNELKTAKAGSGDNAVIYLPERGLVAFLKGTIPAGVDRFTIRGAMPWVEPVFLNDLRSGLKKHDLVLNSRLSPLMKTDSKPEALKMYIPLATISSPSLDSINYWFMKESINLYGEAFIKTIAQKKTGKGETTAGIDIVKEFWKTKGINPGELKIKDGSGLSPANRITPHVLVEILQYASKQTWYASFYNALPLQHNIKMKSGYIGGVRSYAGYIKSKTGEEYTFAFIINNFDGSPAAVREKMWQVLDLLK